MKRCPKCGETKPVAEFCKNRATSDGVCFYCKQCHSVNGKAYHKKFPHKRPERLVRWRKANVDKVRISHTNWVKANRDKVCDKVARRRALQKGATIETVKRQVVYERDKGLCHICGRAAQENNYHLDHIIPLSKGGEHSYRNVAVAHPRCNTRKGAKTQKEAA